MKATPFAAPLGALVEDVDVRDVNPATLAQLAALFREHHVLVFRDQELSPDEQITFAGQWGELVPFPYGHLDGFPNLIELRNRGKQADVNQHWHSDMSYNVRPPKLTMLYARETPALGGDTAFANQILAYEGLSPGLRRFLEGQRAIHTAEDLARLFKQDPDKAPRAEHPVVRTHDESGHKALFVCRAFTRNFVGWSREESAGILEYLHVQSTRMEYQARHHWQAGDLVMWDNRSVLHYAVHDHADQPRVIHRLQVEGPVPV